MVIYKIFVFGADRKSNMAASAHNVFWLVKILKIFLLETTKPIKSTYMQFYIAIAGIGPYRLWLLPVTVK
jgi:hypothetical protein